MKHLTSSIEFLNGIDVTLGNVYKDIKYHCLTYTEVAQERCIKKSEAKELFKRAKDLLKHRETAWCYGLSSRAANALILRYTSFDVLRLDMEYGLVDLEDLDGIGHKVAMEITRWIHSKTHPK